MEFYAVRAMIIAQLNPFQIQRLHQRELERDSCLPPSDIQGIFRLPTSRKAWNVPDEKQGKISPWTHHHDRIWKSLKENHVAAEAGSDWNVIFNGEQQPNLHVFDWQVRKAVEDGTVDFRYKAAAHKSSLVDQVSDEENPTKLAVI